MSLDGTEPQGSGGHPHNGRGKNPPPIWTGKSPGQWRQVQRDLFLLPADADLAPNKRGVCFFRQVSGRARMRTVLKMDT
eukprot:3810181-Amphidinium_carterae.1